MNESHNVFGNKFSRILVPTSLAICLLVLLGCEKPPSAGSEGSPNSLADGSQSSTDTAKEEVMPVEAAIFYVAPGGNDENAGTKEAPFASLERARDAVRNMKQSNALPKGGATVVLREGIYRRSTTFRLDGADSGTEQTPMVYRAYPGEKVRILGGSRFPLSKFAPVTDPAILARLPEEARGRVLQIDLAAAGIPVIDPPPLSGFCMQCLAAVTRYKSGPSSPEVFINGNPGVLARWPNEGYATVGRVVENGDVVRSWMGDKQGTKEYVPKEKRNDPPKGFEFVGDKERIARWANARGIMMFGYWQLNWADQTVQVESIDAQSGNIRSIQPSANGVKSGQRYFVYNLLEEIDTSGEWYADRATGILYLFPPAESGEGWVDISLLKESLVRMEGASFVRFEGMELGVVRGAIFEIREGSSNVISKCTMRNAAGQAANITGGEHHAVSDCQIENMGAGGVFVSGGDMNTLTPGGHLVENNVIRNYARLEHTYRPGIKLGGVGQIARHNVISDAPHFAISFGGNNHLIELNHIHNVCGESDDASAIYAGRSWTSRGTVIRYNLLRDITSYKYGTHRVSGIYLDDGISGTEITGNILVNVAQGLMFNGGRDNSATNNIFIDNENMMRGTDMSKSFTTWAAMSWKTLNEELKKAPLGTEAWKKAYPELEKLASDEPQFPKNNTVKNNLRFNTPLLLGHDTANFAKKGGVADNNQVGLEEKFISYGTVENNPEISTMPGRFDAATGRFVFDEASGVFSMMLGLQSIPVNKIGVIAE